MAELEKRAGYDEVSRAALGFIQKTIGICNSLSNGQEILQSIEISDYSTGLEHDSAMNKTIYQIQCLTELDIWEDIPHRKVCTLEELELMKKLVKNSSFKKYDLRIIKVTSEILENARHSPLSA